MKKTKIEWCDTTLNPVVGCPRGCEYCYARRMNDRYKWLIDFNRPTFIHTRLKALRGKKSKSIFMNSMSDIEFWADYQMQAVITAIKENPKHRYIFLTKGNALPYDLFFYHTFEQNKQDENPPLNKKTADAILGQNVFAGKTITKQADIVFTDYSNFDFWSVEPIHEPIVIEKKGRLKIIIIGAETGNRRGKIIPHKEWIDDIVRQCDTHGIAVFMKDSLSEIMGADFRTDRLPWEVSA